MTPRRFSFLAFALLFAGCAGGSPAGGTAVLSTKDQNPVVLLRPEAGTSVELSAVTYDEFGRIQSYQAKVSSGSATRTIEVKQKQAAEFGKPAEYVATADGKELSTLADSEQNGAIGFTLKDQGGAVLSYTGQLQIAMKSELGYDTNGRGHVKRQEFTHDGASYDIAYSGHAYSESGRLVGYKAVIQKN